MNQRIINSIRKELSDEPADSITTYTFALLTLLKECITGTRLTMGAFMTDHKKQTQTMVVMDSKTQDIYEVSVRLIDKKEQDDLKFN